MIRAEAAAADAKDAGAEVMCFQEGLGLLSPVRIRRVLQPTPTRSRTADHEKMCATREGARHGLVVPMYESVVTGLYYQHRSGQRCGRHLTSASYQKHESAGKGLWRSSISPPERRNPVLRHGRRQRRRGTSATTANFPGWWRAPGLNGRGDVLQSVGEDRGHQRGIWRIGSLRRPWRTCYYAGAINPRSAEELGDNDF